MEDVLQDLTKDLFTSFLGTAIVLLLGALWYWIRVRARETEWIKTHGLMLLVYFRNVDWRCEELRKVLSKGEWKPSGTAGLDLRLKLLKLQADLNALERMAAMWERRFQATAEFWYPHAQAFQRMLDAHSDLHTALQRHIEPLLALLDRATDGLTEHAERNDNDLKAYLAYFTGGRERIWGGRQHVNEPSSPISSLQKMRLRNRLEGMFDPMMKLLDEFQIEGARQLKIWNGELPDETVWFSQPEPAVADSPPSAGSETLPVPAPTAS